MDLNFLPDEYSRVKKVAKRYNATDKSVWRWAADDNNSFPKPYKLTAGVTAWKNSELLEWEKSRSNAEVKP